MPLTYDQILKIEKKEAELPEAKRRDKLTDYREGYFHITLNVRDEAPVLGYMAGKAGGKEGTADEPRVEMTELGRGVEETWHTVPQFHPQVEVIAFQVMPEHIHGLVHLKKGGTTHLGRIVNGFMIGCTHRYWDTLGIDWRNMKTDPSASAQGKRQWQDRDHTRSYRGPALFVRGYNNVEAVTPDEVQTKIDYIRSNPERRIIKGERRPLFAIHRAMRSRNWTWEGAQRAVAADRFFSRNADACRTAWGKVAKRLNINAQRPFYDQNAPSHTNGQNTQGPTNGQNAPSPANAGMSNTTHEASLSSPLLHIDYLGAPTLLNAARKVSLICHRADAGLFEQQRKAVMEAAREGAVVVSAFISPREREIMKELMVEQLPFIQVMDNGFSERYKPGGKAFYACAESRLVQVSCWAYEYQKETAVSREMCLVMNELVRVISKVEDGWWRGV